MQEKLNAVVDSFNKNNISVVGDLATKVVEQIIEADASKSGKHFGGHLERHSFSNQAYPHAVCKAMKNVWFAYSDLGYDGENGYRAKRTIKNLNIILDFFERKLGVKIEPRARY